MVNNENYLETQIKIKGFPSTPGLNGAFGSLAYSVVDETGNNVDIRVRASARKILSKCAVTKNNSHTKFNCQ